MSYTIKQAAKKAGVHPATIRRHIKDGSLIATLDQGPYGEQYFIEERDLEEYIQKQAAEVTEVVQVERSLPVEQLREELRRAVREEVREETRAAVQEEVSELKEEVHKLKAQLEARDREIMETIREKQEPSPSLWSKIKGWLRG